MATRNINRRAVRNHKRPTLRENRSNVRSHRKLYESHCDGFGENEYVETLGGFEIYDLGDGCFALELASEFYGDDRGEIEVGFWDDDLTDDSYRFDFKNCKFFGGRHAEPVDILDFLNDHQGTGLVNFFAPYIAELCEILAVSGNVYMVLLDEDGLIDAIDSYNDEELYDMVFESDSVPTRADEEVAYVVARLLENGEVSIPSGFDVDDAFVDAVTCELKAPITDEVKTRVRDIVSGWGRDADLSDLPIKYSGTVGFPALYIRAENIGQFIERLIEMICDDTDNEPRKRCSDFNFAKYRALNGSFNDYVYKSGAGFNLDDVIEDMIVGWAWNDINWDNVRRNLNRTTNESYRRHYTRRSPRTIRESINRRPYHRPIHNRTSYRR